MRLREFISEKDIYNRCEREIKEWTEQAYPGLSIVFFPHIEVVQVDNSVRYTKRRVRKIIEVVNIKIGDILENHAEEIYIAERLERIYQRHPEFDLEIESMEDIKRNPLFCNYLKELIIPNFKEAMTNV